MCGSRLYGCRIFFLWDAAGAMGHGLGGMGKFT